MTSTANGAAFDFNVLIVMAAPVMIGVWVYMVYAIVTWRSSRVKVDPVGGERASPTPEGIVLVCEVRGERVPADGFCFDGADGHVYTDGSGLRPTQ